MTDIAPSICLVNGNPAEISIEIHPEILDSLLRGNWLAAHEIAMSNKIEFQADGFQPDGIKINVQKLRET